MAGEQAQPETSSPQPKTRRKKAKPKKPRRAKGGKKEARATRPYPKVVLAKALEVAQQIKDKNGGNPWTPAEVAAALGMGAHSPAFYYLTAAARDFGLTLGTRDTPQIELTDLGRAIVYAPSPDAEKAKKLEAFQKIELFTKVLAHYKGSNLPEMKYVGNTLESKFGLAPQFHEEFSRVFKENCAYLGITSGEAPAEGEHGGPSTVTVGEPAKKSGVRAFVVMPFTEKGDARPKGFFTEVLRSLITPAAVEAGFNVQTANRQGSDVIQSTIVNDLLDADLVIADLTDHNPNVLFELGLRMAAEKPVALVKALGTGRVFDVDNMLRVYEYQPQLWRSTLEQDLPEITKHVKAAWDNRAKDPSYMSILRRATANGGEPK